MAMDVIDYEIFCDDVQYVEVELRDQVNDPIERSQPCP